MVASIETGLKCDQPAWNAVPGKLLLKRMDTVCLTFSPVYGAPLCNMWIRC